MDGQALWLNETVILGEPRIPGQIGYYIRILLLPGELGIRRAGRPGHNPGHGGRPLQQPLQPHHRPSAPGTGRP